MGAQTKGVVRVVRMIHGIITSSQAAAGGVFFVCERVFVAKGAPLQLTAFFVHRFRSLLLGGGQVARHCDKRDVLCVVLHEVKSSLLF